MFEERRCGSEDRASYQENWEASKTYKNRGSAVKDSAHTYVSDTGYDPYVPPYMQGIKGEIPVF